MSTLLVTTCCYVEIYAGIPEGWIWKVEPSDFAVAPHSEIQVKLNLVFSRKLNSIEELVPFLNLISFLDQIYINFRYFWVFDKMQGRRGGGGGMLVDLYSIFLK